MADSAIEWTDKVWNPTRGCSRTSPGCGGGTPGGGGGCYAERQAYRFSGPGMPYEGLVELGKNGQRWTGVLRLVPEMLDAPLRWKKPRRVFVNSMSDLFHEKLSNEEIAAVFGAMVAAPQHTFQVLTKRAARMRAWFEWMCGAAQAPGGDGEVRRCLGLAASKGLEWSRHVIYPAWPLPNVHLGVSVEDQPRAEERVPLLLQTPAAVRFLSVEPLLGPVTMSSRWLGLGENRPRAGECVDIDGNSWHQPKDLSCDLCGHGWPKVDWCIVGGEGGPGARPFDLAWGRRIIADCKAAGVPTFFKQAGSNAYDDAGLGQEFKSHQQWVDKGRSWLASGTWALFDARGRLCRDGADMARARDEDAFPVRALPRLTLKAPKGGDLEELPADLRVREMPTVRA